MANWSDPRPGVSAYAASDARGAAYDAGLRSYMLSVYNYMASAVLLTGVVAMLFAKTEWVNSLFVMNDAGQRAGFSGIGWIVLLAPIGIVLFMNYAQRSMSTSTLQLGFWAFAFVNGLSLSTLFLRYTDVSIAQAFFATAAGFAGLSLWGYTTKRDLSGMGTFLVMGLVGLIVAMLLNALVFQSTQMQLVTSAVGVLIFAGFTAFDTQKIKSMYDYVAGTEMQGKVVIMGALNLYLDFINMFIFLLRLFGSSRN